MSREPEEGYLSAFKREVTRRDIPMYEFAIVRNGMIEPRENTTWGNLLNAAMNYEGIKGILSQSIKDRFHEDWDSFVSGRNMNIDNITDFLENIRALRGMNQASADEYFRDELEEGEINNTEDVVDEDEAFTEINMDNEEHAQRNEDAMLTYPQTRNADIDESNANYDESDDYDDMEEDDD